MSRRELSRRPSAVVPNSSGNHEACLRIPVCGGEPRRGGDAELVPTLSLLNWSLDVLGGHFHWETLILGLDS